MVRDNSSELNQRELEILQYREQGLSYKKIGDVLGVTANRVSQLHHRAISKQRAKRAHELATIKNQRIIKTEFTVSELHIILTALRCIRHQKSAEVRHTLKELDRLEKEDIEYRGAADLIEKISELVKK